MRTVSSFLLLATLAWGSGGCVTVRATERESLADPVMALDVDRDNERLRGHVLEVREASRGGLGLEGAGCGCN